MCYNFATFVLYLDVITLIYRENRLTSSETCLSAKSSMSNIVELFFYALSGQASFGSNNIVVFLTIQYYCLSLRHE